MENTGLVHIYTGDGKGKTTAAVGLAVRCAGAGGKVLFSRFLKSNDSGELNVLSKIPGITVMDNPKVFHMIHLKGKVPEGAAEYYKERFEGTVSEAMKGEYDLLVMDEIIATVNYGFVSVSELLDFLKEKPRNLETVLTGRDPAAQLLEAADYVSEIKKVKHPFDKGIVAREGIEY